MKEATRPLVFISSLIRGYSEMRDAAARGIQRADCEPRRAEEFALPPGSPRNACLDEVGDCDGLVLILGTRYGDMTDSGYSATEDEYNEAVRLHKRIFVFLERGDAEPRQADFIKRVESYIGGNWRKSFATSKELEQLVEHVIRKDETMRRADGTEEHRAAARISNAFHSRPQHVQGLAWMQVAWAILRDDEVINPTLFMDGGFVNEVQALAHAGKPPLFSYDLGKDKQTSTSSLRIAQEKTRDGRQGHDLVELALYKDGTVSVSSNVTNLKRGNANDSFAHWRIDPNDASKRLQQAWGFAARWWDYRDKVQRQEVYLYNVALFDIENCRFEEAPKEHSNSFNLSMKPRPNPLFVYDSPRLISRHDFQDPDRQITDMVRMLKMRFDELG